MEVSETNDGYVVMLRARMFRSSSSLTMRSVLKLKPVADEQVFYDEFVNMTSALSEKLAH